MRKIVAAFGYIFLFLSLPVGLLIGFAVVAPFLGGERVQVVALLIPAIPFVLIGWLLLRAAGHTKSKEVNGGAVLALLAGMVATFILFVNMAG